MQGDSIVTNKTDMNNPVKTTPNYTNPAPGVNTPRWERADYYANRTAVAALFTNTADGERAINALKVAGVNADQIGIAMRDRTAQGVVIEETGTHATKGAVKGAVGGGLLGGLAGFLVGIGALAIPGIGPVVSAGVLTTVLGTVGATVAYVLYGTTHFTPLLLAAYLGFYINLFNLIPAGMLDGGWILAPVSKWFQVFGLALLAFLVIFVGISPIILLFILLGLPTVFARFRNDKDPYYQAVPVAARWAIGAAWLVLAVYLGFASYQAHTELLPYLG